MVNNILIKLIINIKQLVKDKTVYYDDGWSSISSKINVLCFNILSFYFYKSRQFSLAVAQSRKLGINWFTRIGEDGRIVRTRGLE